MGEPTDSIKYGRYEILREVGRGAMGVVYQARDPNIDRVVAVKVLRQDRLDNENVVKRFLKEARVIGRLSHPNIVTIYDVGEAQGNIYIAMEFLQGKSLADLTRERRLESEEVVNIAIQIAETLNYAHGKGVIHRDIKPSNIIVEPNGKIKITDFGIAHLEDSSATLQTQTGEIMGTPAYMSPEQVLGQPVDGRSDIFSLGVVLYELSTGKRPFGGEGKSLANIFNDIVQHTPEEPHATEISIPPELSSIVMKALRKDPADRYASGESLAEELKTYLSGEKPASVTTPPLPAGKAKYYRTGLAVAVSFFTIIGAVYLFYDKEESSKPVSREPKASKPMTAPTVPPSAVQHAVPASQTGKTPGMINASAALPKDMHKDLRSSPSATPRTTEKSVNVEHVAVPLTTYKRSVRTIPLMIKTNPGGADVFVDGMTKGATPLRLILPMGKHQVTLNHAGYVVVEKQITVDEAMENPLVFNLTKSRN